MGSGQQPSIILAGGFAALVGAAGCATTGLAWVHETESGVDLSAPSGDAAKSPTGGSAVAAFGGPRAEVAPLAEGRAARRIARSITLGETTGVTAASGETAVRPGSQPAPVVVNIYVASAPPAVYGPVYGVVSRGAGAPPVASRAATVRPGLDWAPPPSYGPAFPYRMAPSSPWNGDGSERTRRK